MPDAWVSSAKARQAIEREVKIFIRGDDTTVQTKEWIGWGLAGEGFKTTKLAHKDADLEEKGWKESEGNGNKSYCCVELG